MSYMILSHLAVNGKILWIFILR